MYDLLRLDKSQRPECRSCPSFERIYVPPTIVRGSTLVAIAERPGEIEAEEGAVLVGPAGRTFTSICEKAGESRDNLSLWNACNCYAKGNPAPTIEEIEACSGLVSQFLTQVQPKVILALGQHATSRLVGDKKLVKWRGSIIGAPSRVVLGKKTVQDGSTLFKSGPRKGQSKPVKVEVTIDQEFLAGTPVIPTYHPVLVREASPVFLPIVVPDFRRARALAKGQPLIEVGRNIVAEPMDASMAGIILEASKEVVLDVETDGIGGELTLVGLAPDLDYAATFRPSPELDEVLRRALAEKDRLLIGQNIGYDFTILERYVPGCRVESRLWDTMHASYFDRPDLSETIRPKALENIASRMSGHHYHNWKAAFREGHTPLAWYCANDCTWTYAIFDEYRLKLQKTGGLHFFESHMMRTLPVLTRLTQIGVQIDVPHLQVLHAAQTGLVSRLETAWDEATGGVNAASQPALRSYFYDGLNLPIQYNGRGHKRSVTLDEGACERLLQLRPDVPALGILADLRHARKMLSTYLTPELDENGRFHASYNMSGSKMGRLSGDIQQVPRKGKACVRGLTECQCIHVREIFVADPGDMGLGVGDSSQIEFRLWEPLTHDPAIAAIYAPGGRGDIHGWAADIFGISRQSAKPITHGGMFDRGAKAIAEDVGCSISKAQSFLDRLSAEFAVTSQWKSRMTTLARQNGYITNPFGRRGFFKVDSKGRVASTEVAAFGPQSTAAAIMTIQIYRAWESGLKLRFTVHDELGISARVPADLQLLKAVMEEPFSELGGFSNPADVGLGPNWSAAKS